MDNQQDQLGGSTSPNASRSSQPSATGSARKTPTAPMSQSTVANSMTGGASHETTATAGADRQGEGQQTNGQDGNILDTALQSGKKWIEDSGVLNRVSELPQTVKDWSNRAVSRVGDLTTTQKIVGGALLAAGIGYLATRKGKSSGKSTYSASGRQESGSYGRKSAGYQAPDASTSRRPVAGSGRTDSSSAYGNSGSRYGGSGSSYSSANQAKGNINTSGDGPLSGSSRSESGSGFGTSSSANASDHGSRTSESSSRKNDDFRSIE